MTTNKSIKLDSTAKYVALFAVISVCLLFVFFAVKWTFAGAALLQADTRQIADAAVYLSPDDPQAHRVLAVLDEKSFLPEDFSNSLAEYEKAAALAPNDYRSWFLLGRSRERAGDPAGAEIALRKSLELAPNYSQVNWALGNLLLREGKTAEAFLQIRRAAEIDPSYANAAIVTAWQTFDGDFAQLKNSLGDSPPVKSALAAFLVKQQHFNEAFDEWNALAGDDKRTTFRENSQALADALLQAKKFRAAVSVSEQIAAANASKSTPEQIANGDFEADVKLTGATPFEWQIADGLQPIIGPNEEQKHGGRRSLLIAFNSPGGQDFRAVQQTIIVAPNQKYTFEAFAHGDLKTAATVKWEIINAADGKILASTEAAAAASDWTPLRAEFTTLPATEAVTIRLARVACPSPVCPITGKVWFDDLSLRK